eukprot:5550-Heterococcus_DN1.PRE.9
MSYAICGYKQAAQHQVCITFDKPSCSVDSSPLPVSSATSSTVTCNSKRSKLMRHHCTALRNEMRVSSSVYAHIRPVVACNGRTCTCWRECS